MFGKYFLLNLQIPFQTHLAVTLPACDLPCKNDDTIFSPPCRENDLEMQLPIQSRLKPIVNREKDIQELF